jgi:hypothetical protein
MWLLWPEVAPHSRDLSGEMQAESFEIPRRSLIVVPGTAFAYACHSLLAGSSEAESEAPSISEKNKPSLHIVCLPSFVHLEVQHMEVRPERRPSYGTSWALSSAPCPCDRRGTATAIPRERVSHSARWCRDDAGANGTQVGRGEATESITLGERRSTCSERSNLSSCC